jgi:hypothetical protein
MPTYDWLPGAGREYLKLTIEKRAVFMRAVAEMVEDMRAHRPFRASLDIKPVKRARGVWEMTWETGNGRATFEYGAEQEPGERHVIWRRIGGHEIFERP